MGGMVTRGIWHARAVAGLCTSHPGPHLRLAVHFNMRARPRAPEILTDHSIHMFWTATQNLSCCQACWALWLSCFLSTFMHKLGKANTLMDMPSHGANHETIDTDDNQGVLVLGPNHFCTAANPLLSICLPWQKTSALHLHCYIHTGVCKEVMVLA
jgi:hypothetical protein